MSNIPAGYDAILAEKSLRGIGDEWSDRAQQRYDGYMKLKEAYERDVNPELVAARNSREKPVRKAGKNLASLWWGNRGSKPSVDVVETPVIDMPVEDPVFDMPVDDPVDIISDRPSRPNRPNKPNKPSKPFKPGRPGGDDSALMDALELAGSMNNNSGVIGSGTQYNNSGNVRGKNNMGGIKNRNTNNSINTGDITSIIGKRGDMDFTVGNNNVFGPGSMINSDFSSIYGGYDFSPRALREGFNGLSFS